MIFAVEPGLHELVGPDPNPPPLRELFMGRGMRRSEVGTLRSNGRPVLVIVRRGEGEQRRRSRRGRRRPYNRVVDAPGEQLVIRLWETVVDKGLGGLLSPWQTRRIARARIGVQREERLALAQAERDIEQIRSGRKRFTADYKLVEGRPEDETAADQGAVFCDLAATAQRNLLLEQMRGEVNVSKSLLQAEAELEGDAQAPPDGTVEDDWLIRWRDSASKVSSERLQTLWGQVLAGEIKSPGTFSLRTLEFLKNLSQEEARRIEKLAPFVIDNSFVFSGNQTALESEGISFGRLVELQDLGIITQANAGLLVTMQIPQSGRGVFSHNRMLMVTPATDKTDLDLAAFRLTSLGSQVLRLGSFTTHETYFRSVGEEIKRHGFKVVMARYVPLAGSQVRYFAEEAL